MARERVLFYDGELRDALEGQARTLAAEIEKAPEEHLLQADEDAWVAALVERYQVAAPQLLTDQWYMDKPAEIKIDVSGDHMRAVFDRSRPAYVNGFRVRVHVPFRGEADVFKFTPDTRNYNPPRAVIARSEVLIDVEYPHDAPADVRAVALGVVGGIDNYLGWARGDIQVFNDGLEARARAAIQARRNRVRDAYDRLAETGIPLRQAGEQPKTYIADALVRRPSPTISNVTTQAVIPLEPVLADEIFEHILGVIRATAEAMERSPATYVGMGEDDRRQVIVAALNTHYQGQTTAEAFNVSGKTDILVRHAEGRNLFIGECKIWSGSKDFSATIDQLFGYAAWRDSKLAVVMFVKEKGLTEIVQKAQETLSAHSQFVGWHGEQKEAELRATMKWPGDEERHADLNVFLVHTVE